MFPRTLGGRTVILRRLINSVRLTRAISKLRKGQLDQSDRILAGLKFNGLYQSLTLSMRAFIALIKTDNRTAVRLLEASNAGCTKSDHIDSKYIGLYNDYLSATIADDLDRFVEAWHALQAAPSTRPVHDALFVARLPSRDEVRSFGRKAIIH